MERLLADYRAWKLEQDEFLEELEEHDTMIYDRWLPVLAVMDHLDEKIRTKAIKPNQEIETIAETGAAFLNDQVQTAKLYLDTAFKGDLHHFLEYETVVCYLLTIDDVRYELAEKNAAFDPEGFMALQDELESILDEKKEIPDALGIYVDDKVKALSGEHYDSFYGIIDIFMDVADALGIDIYESEDIVVGRDLGV
jgi:hypothetical protein